MIPALANHLLQSTIFAAVAGTLTLCLRNNHARTYYWIWLTASMKFLIPFSVFVEIGHRLSWSAAPVLVQPRLAIVMDEIGQPFAVPYFSVAVPASPASTPSILPALLLVIWICGCAAVLIFWFVRWQRVAGVLRTASPVKDGREGDSLRRVEAIAGIKGPIGLVSSVTQIEPGVFGILRPVLYLPAGLTDHLDDAHLDAVVAHELCHIRSRDNLTAALHMLVEAIFWFHPLVWWIGAKLVEERERACDEEVVRLGSDPEMYAESILRICRFYLASPLVCAAGISGSDLGRRIENIMKNPLLSGMSRGKKLMIGTMGLLAVGAPIALGVLSAPASHGKPTAVPALAQALARIDVAPQRQLLAQAAQAPARSRAPATDSTESAAPPAVRLEFDAASIRPSQPPGPGSILGCHGGQGSSDPGRLVCTNMNPVWLVRIAYNLNDYQVLAPGYTGKDAFDITATIPQGVTKEQYFLMFQNLLADRFKLVVHSEKKEMPVYELVVGKGGAKVKASVAAADAPPFGGSPPEISKDKDGFPIVPAGITMFVGSGDRARYQVSGESMEKVAAMLSHYVDRPMIDATGLKGNYDFSLYFVPYPPGMIAQADGPGPTLTDALQEQLGLRLLPAKDAIEVLVVDHMEKAPTEN